MHQLVDLMQAQMVPGTSPAPQAGGQVPQSAPDVTSLTQLMMIKKLRRGRRKSYSDSDSEDGSEGGLRQVHLLRSNVSKNQAKSLKTYTKRCTDSLSITDPRQPWKFHDYSLKTIRPFGRMKGLWQVHFALSDILQAADAKEQEQVDGLKVQLLKCMHQVALDQGSCQKAQYLLPHQNLVQAEEFGGDPIELRKVYKFQKALHKLQARKTREDSEGEEQGDEPKTRNDRRVAAAKAKAAATAAEDKDEDDH